MAIETVYVRDLSKAQLSNLFYVLVSVYCTDWRVLLMSTKVVYWVEIKLYGFMIIKIYILLF